MIFELESGVSSPVVTKKSYVLIQGQRNLLIIPKDGQQIPSEVNFGGVLPADIQRLIVLANQHTLLLVLPNEIFKYDLLTSELQSLVKVQQMLAVDYNPVCDKLLIQSYSESNEFSWRDVPTVEELNLYNMEEFKLESAIKYLPVKQVKTNHGPYEVLLHNNGQLAALVSGGKLLICDFAHNELRKVENLAQADLQLQSVAWMPKDEELIMAVGSYSLKNISYVLKLQISTMTLEESQQWKTAAPGLRQHMMENLGNYPPMMRNFIHKIQYVPKVYLPIQGIINKVLISDDNNIAVLWQPAQPLSPNVYVFNTTVNKGQNSGLKLLSHLRNQILSTHLESEKVVVFSQSTRYTTSPFLMEIHTFTVPQ